MPVLPEVESTRILLWDINPARSASRIMFRAGRSLTEPPGFAHSALAQSSTSGYSAPILCIRRRGVFPIRERRSVAQHATACSDSKEAGTAAWPEISLETCSSEFGGGEV